MPPAISQFLEIAIMQKRNHKVIIHIKSPLTDSIILLSYVVI